MKPLFIITLFSFFSITLGQINPKTSWGKVSDEEINYKQVHFDPDASAVILYEEGLMRIDREYETRVYRRIKILDEKGVDAANQSIALYTHDNIEKISSIKAQTINLENGKTETYAVDRKEFFDSKINEFWSEKKFTFPNVKVGSILEFEYVLHNKGLYTMDAWYFQHELPTLYSKFEIKNQSFRDYTTLAIGNLLFQSNKKHTSSPWVLTNVPSFHSIPFLFNSKDMSERISLQLKGYHKRSGALDNQIQYESVMTEWRTLNSKMLDLYKQYTNNAIGKEIEKEIANGNSDTQTLQNIYDYFKKNYKWNSIYGIYPKKSNREIHQSKVGSSSELNLLFNTILKAKGIKTDLIFVSSRRNGKLITSYPYLGQFNSVINLVTTNDGFLYLIDAADLTFDLGYASLDNYNYYGLIVDAKKEELIKLSPPISVYQSVQNYSIKDDHFLVTHTKKRKGYFKEKDQNHLAGTLKTNPINYAVDLLTTEINNQTRESDEDNFQLERIHSKTHPFTTGKFISIENPLKSVLSNFHLPEKNRIRTLEFNFPFHYITQSIIEIPSGFQVEIPQAFNQLQQIKNDDLIYNQKAEIIDGKLILQVEFQLGKYLLEGNYPAVQDFFNKAIQASNQVILFKKN